MMLRLIANTLSLVTVLTGSTAPAQLPPGPGRQTLVDELLAKLGDRDFATREAASRELLVIGRDARPAVLKALRVSPIPEISARCQRLLPKIDFNFCWDRASRILGDTPAARQQFAEMYRTEGELWYALAEGNPDLGLKYAARCKEMAAGPPRDRFGIHPETTGPCRHELVEERLATLLIIGAECHRRIPQGALEMATRFFLQRWGGQYAKNTPPLLRKSYVTWAEEIAPLPIEYTGNKKLDLARAALRSSSAAASDRQYALLTVARAKDKHDDELIRRFLTDAAVCDTLFRRGVKTQVQVRDVALAATIYRAGKDPIPFGFKNLQPDTELIYRPSSLGFAGDDTRSEAFQMWSDTIGKSR